MFYDDKNPIEPEYTPFSQTQEERFNGSYGTGSTCPPKTHGGLVAAVLLSCIFCGGLVGGILLTAGLQPTQNSVGTPNPSAGSSLVASTVPFETGTATEPATQSPLEPTGSGEDAELLISDTPHPVENVPQEGGLSLQAIYKKVRPSVVSITAAQATGQAYGSGIIMTDDGYIITNCHVVDGAYALTVRLDSGLEYEAQLIGKDSVSDLAVLRIQAENLTPAEFGDSDQAAAGDAVAAIGDPLGPELAGTMTDGIISAINRNLTVQGRKMTLLQTSAALNEGNSGGPLINCYGQVIGINTAKVGDYYSSAGVEGLGFAIPINTAKEVVDQLLETGYVPGRPSLGVTTTVLEFQYRIFYGLPEGLYVSEIEKGGEAWEAGLRAGDVITYVEGQAVASQDDLNAALGELSVGDQVEVVIYRNGHQYRTQLTLQEAGG